MCTAGGLNNGTCGPSNNPVATSYIAGIVSDPLDCNDGYPSWDLVTTYAAIFGADAAGLNAADGENFVNEDGLEAFNTDDTGHNQYRLTWKSVGAMQPLADLFNQILCMGNDFKQLSATT